MYIPHHFRQGDRAQAIAFMKQHPFATIVSSVEGRPLATHLPFHVINNGEELILTAHFARANPQWKHLEEILVIFQGPHAYISPQHYTKEENVPTWNYIAVHAYGKGEIVTDYSKGMAILEDMMQQSEPGFLEQWSRLSPDYKHKLYKGIVPFEVKVTGLDAKQKLSQNKTEEERLRIMAALAGEEDTAAHEIASYMHDNERRISS